ncbi:MAG: DUF6600 domain-containing protein [Myxococcaceae bacterium]
MGLALKASLSGLVICFAFSAAAQSYEDRYDGQYDDNGWSDDDENVFQGSNAGVASGYYDAPPAVMPTQQVFEMELTPYGRWLWVPGVGRVWQPYSQIVGSDFVPYSTGGQWMNSSYGWTFRSNYSWGWAPFHYGRWHMASGYGWVWQPGYTWGPSWVTFRSAPGYVAWAPLPPAGFQLSFGIGDPGWCFVQRQHFARPFIHRYALPGSYFHRAAPVHGRGWGHGWQNSAPQYVQRGHGRGHGRMMRGDAYAPTRQMPYAPSRMTPPPARAMPQGPVHRMPYAPRQVMPQAPMQRMPQMPSRVMPQGPRMAPPSSFQAMPQAPRSGWQQVQRSPSPTPMVQARGTPFGQSRGNGMHAPPSMGHRGGGGPPNGRARAAGF